MKSSAKLGAFLKLHILILIYSLGAVCSKQASSYEFLSKGFIICYAGLILSLGLYAIGWQQVIKAIPLSIAFANKAITLIWGIIWGLLLFGERVTVGKVVGSIIVIIGVIIYVLDDGSEARNE